MIWSDNDVANDFTTKKNEAGDQVRIGIILPPTFQPVKINHYFYNLINILIFCRRQFYAEI